MKKVELFTKPRLLPAMLVAATLFVLMAFAPTQQQIGDEGWTLLTSEQGVNAYAMESNCDKNDLYVFKFENNTDKLVEFTYTLTAKLDPTFPPITKRVELGAKKSISGNCETLWETALPNRHRAKGDLKSQIEVIIIINQ